MHALLFSLALLLREAVLTGDDVHALELGQQAQSVEERAWFLASLWRSGWRTRAFDEAKELTRRHPRDPWAWFALANLQRQDPALGMPDFGLAASAHLPLDNEDFLIVRMEALTVDGRFAEAIALAERRPRSAAVLVAKARAIVASTYATERDTTPRIRRALAVLAKARELDPRSASALRDTARVLSENLKRNDEALPLIERALALTPHSLTVHEVYWNVIAGDRAGIERDLAKLLDAQPNDPATVLRCMQKYESLGNAEAAARLKDRILTTMAATPQADTIRSDEAIAAKTDRRKALREFIARPHPDPLLLGTPYLFLFSELARDPSSSISELLDALEGVLRYDYHRSNQLRFYSRAAIILADRGVGLDEALSLARRGLALALSPPGREQRTRPRDQVAMQRKGEEALMRDALGWVLFKRGDTERAGAELDKAARLYADMPSIWYHRGQLAEHERAFERAAEEYTKGAVIAAREANPNLAALQALYERRHGSLDGFDGWFASLKETATNRRRSTALATRLRPPRAAPKFNATPFVGPALDLRGKVTVVNFWGVWCDACVVEMPDLVKLIKRYEGDRDVQIVTIDVDDTPEKLRKWLDEQHYSFRVLRGDAMLAASGVHAFPTTWFLDRDGRIAYEVVGAIPSLVEQFAWRIDSLK